MTKNGVTMKDVAKKACVTTQTVSRALGGGSVNPETRKRIIKIAEQLGYIKNSSASALRSGRAKMVAVLYDDPRNLFFPLMTDFLQDHFQKKGYMILTIAVKKQQMDMETYNLSLSQNVSGIVTYLEPTEEFDTPIVGKKLPMLLFGRHTESTNFDCLEFDDRLGGTLAANRLLHEDGCKKVLYVTAGTSISCFNRRFDGFKSVIDEAKDVEYEVVDVTEISEKLDALDKNNALPDGVFCFSDMSAMTVLSWFDGKGKHAPKVVGFDDLSGEVPLPCRLTSIGADKNEMAKCAVDILLNRMDGAKGPCVRETMPVYLTEGTTG